MMKLSELLPKYLPQYEFDMKNERSFSTLGLVGSNTGRDKCTFLDRPEFANKLPADVKMVITTKDYANADFADSVGVCIVENPRVVFFRLHNALANEEAYAGGKEPTIIGENCRIHPTAIISDYNVRIGDNVIIDEYVVIKNNVQIGDNCIIHAGVKLGDSDFEFKREGNEIFGVTHCGSVVIGHDVEILANTGVNKALYPWDSTVIEDYVKIDMLCNISHGVKIGKETMIVALSGVGGRTVIGEKCWIGYGCIIRNGIVIGDNARVNMGAIVTRNVESNQAVTGNFAIEHEKFMEDLKLRSK